MFETLADKIYERFAGRGSFAWQNSTDSEAAAKARATSYVIDAINRTMDKKKQPWYLEYEKFLSRQKEVV